MKTAPARALRASPCAGPYAPPAQFDVWEPIRDTPRPLDPPQLTKRDRQATLTRVAAQHAQNARRIDCAVLDRGGQPDRTSRSSRRAAPQGQPLASVPGHRRRHYLAGAHVRQSARSRGDGVLRPFAPPENAEQPFLDRQIRDVPRIELRKRLAGHHCFEQFAEGGAVRTRACNVQRDCPVAELMADLPVLDGNGNSSASGAKMTPEGMQSPRGIPNANQNHRTRAAMHATRLLSLASI